MVGFFVKPTIFCHCEEGAILCARRGNLKVKGMESPGEIQDYEMRQDKKHKVLASNVRCIPFRLAFLNFVPGCRFDPSKIATAVIRPRNDRKTVGSIIKPTVFLFAMFQIRRGATSQLFIFQFSVFTLPGSAISCGRNLHFTCAVSFTCSKSKFHCKTMQPTAVSYCKTRLCSARALTSSSRRRKMRGKVTKITVAVISPAARSAMPSER